VRSYFIRSLTIAIAALLFDVAAGAAAPSSGARPDTQTLQLWLHRAEQGGADAQYALGYMYATGKGAPQDYIEAGRWLRLAAARGHAKALWAVGLLHDNGWGVPVDHAEGLRWYRLAAEKGEPQAQTNVGYFYAEGLVVEQNFEEAVKWYRLAARQGLAEGMIALGNFYEEGLGVAQDYPRALMWLNVAAQGLRADRIPRRELEQRVRVLARKMTREQLREAEQIGRLCAEMNFATCD
jgi:TPR repeat protein